MTKKVLAVVAVILFLLVLPLSLQINFSQNDDWAYRQCVKSYMEGDFSVNPLTIFNKSAPTFYVQGIIGALFSLAFGIDKLPVLTLFVSVLNFYLLAVILNRFFNRTSLESMLFSLLVFFNPIYFYSILGFMTENYFLLFVLLAFFYILEFERESKPFDFVIANAFLLLGFFVRQFAFFVSFSYALYLLFNKKLKYGLIQLGLSVLTYLAYTMLFLAKTELADAGLNLAHVLDVRYAFTVLVAIAIYVTAYFTPLLFVAVDGFSIRRNFEKVVLFGLLFAGFNLLVPSVFFPGTLYSAEFPFFGNTVDKTGFLTRDLVGMKTNFYGMFDFYRLWEFLAKGLLFLIPLLVIKFWKRLRENFFSFLLVIFVPFMVVVIQVYDRYLGIIFVALILFIAALIKERRLRLLEKGLLWSSVFVLMFLCYQFGNDFVQTNRYIWDKSAKLGIPKSSISATSAWNRTHGVYNVKYMFSYDSLGVCGEKCAGYNLVEEQDITFPLSFYVNNQIFLYEVFR